ncbi:MAG: CotH kinase family protein [Acidobacteriota bacterium]
MAPLRTGLGGIVLLGMALAMTTLDGRGVQYAPEPPPLEAPGFSQRDFFQQNRVWDAHLTFTQDQWTALQPRQAWGSGGGFGGRLQGPEGGRNGVAARQGIQFDYVHAGIEIDGKRFEDVAVRYKGNGSYLRARGSDKISLKVDFNKYVKGQKLAGVTTINFQNNITDIGWMNEVLAYQLYRDAGVLAPRTSYARLYVTVAGRFDRRYVGLYSISENIDENFLEDRFGTREGAILKPSTQRPFTSLGDDWAGYNQTYDPKTDLTDAEKRRIIEFSTFVSTASDADFAARIGSYLDLDEFARYLAVLAWIANSDSLLQIGQNYYVYLHPATNKLMFAAWDQDGSFGNFRGGSTNRTIYYPWTGDNPFLARVYGVEAFRTLYLARMAEFSQTLFRPERFAEQIARIAPALRPSVAVEGAQWLPGFDQIAAGEAGIMPFVRARAPFVAGELGQRP